MEFFYNGYLYLDLKFFLEEHEKLKNENKPIGRKDNIVVQEMDGEVLIYDLINNRAFCLNQTSALVWQNCDGTKTVAEISDVLGRELKSQTNEDVVWLAINQLSKEKLLLQEPATVNKFAGLSRREVIKKVGLASAIAIPVITSLVAPMAIHAASTCIAGNACTCTNASGNSGDPCTPTAGTACAVDCICRRTNNGNVMGICGP
jgi:hypothetical protein